MGSLSSTCLEDSAESRHGAQPPDLWASAFAKIPGHPDVYFTEERCPEMPGELSAYQHTEGSENPQVKSQFALLDPHSLQRI